MIITGVFLFLLGTKLGGCVPTPARTEVKYEGPNKITIIEDTGNDRILPENIPQSGNNFIQQGSNFYFNPVLPTAVIPQLFERIIPTIQNCCKNIIVTNPEKDVLVEEKPVELDPLIEIEPVEVVENCEPEVLIPEVVVPEVVMPEVIEIGQITGNIEVEVQPLPLIPEAPELPILVMPELPLLIPPVEVDELPEVPKLECDIPVVSEIDIPVSPVIVKEPFIEVVEQIVPIEIPDAPVLPPLVIPELPLQVNALPDLIVEPIVPEVSIPVLPDIEIPAPVFIQEIDVTLNEIPSPPELPPLVIVEKPTIVEDKKIILMPAAPALPIEAIVPPQVVVENSVLPTICARNIVLDRVIPRIIYEQTQKIELISFPSARIVPVYKKSPILTLVAN